MATQAQNRDRHDAPVLSSLEWKVVSLAMREANAAEPEAMSWIGRLFRRATGIEPKMPLADPRLETLRRFVTRIRRRADVSELRKRLVAEYGFSARQISAVAMLAR